MSIEKYMGDVKRTNISYNEKSRTSGKKATMEKHCNSNPHYNASQYNECSAGDVETHTHSQ